MFLFFMYAMEIDNLVTIRTHKSYVAFKHASQCFFFLQILQTFGQLKKSSGGWKSSLHLKLRT